MEREKDRSRISPVSYESAGKIKQLNKLFMDYVYVFTASSEPTRSPFVPSPKPGNRGRPPQGSKKDNNVRRNSNSQEDSKIQQEADKMARVRHQSKCIHNG